MDDPANGWKSDWVSLWVSWLLCISFNILVYKCLVRGYLFGCGTIGQKWDMMLQMLDLLSDFLVDISVDISLLVDSPVDIYICFDILVDNCFDIFLVRGYLFGCGIKVQLGPKWKVLMRMVRNLT